MLSSHYSLLLQSAPGSDWNWLLIFVIFVVIVAIALIIQTKFSAQKADELAEQIHHEHHEEEKAEEHPEPEETAEPAGETKSAEIAISEPAEPPKPDDLKKIEGIGPKVASILNENNITTFAQLANTPVEQLEQILNAAKLQMMNPGSWPRQAQLAAEGKWEALQELQDNLKGGR